MAQKFAQAEVYFGTITSGGGGGGSGGGGGGGGSAAFGLQVNSSGKIVDQNGTLVKLRGSNISDQEFEPQDGFTTAGLFSGVPDFGAPGDGTISGTTLSTMVTAMGSWGLNIVRIPVNEGAWLQADPYYNSGNGYPHADPTCNGTNYRDHIDTMISAFTGASIAVILDLHGAMPNDTTIEMVDGPVRTIGAAEALMADTDHSIAFWTSAANRYKNNPAVLFDLYNEPHPEYGGGSWATWLSGATLNKYVTGQVPQWNGTAKLGTGTYTAGATVPTSIPYTNLAGGPLYPGTAISIAPDSGTTVTAYVASPGASATSGTLPLVTYPTVTCASTSAGVALSSITTLHVTGSTSGLPASGGIQVTSSAASGEIFTYTGTTTNTFTGCSYQGFNNSATISTGAVISVAGIPPTWNSTYSSGANITPGTWPFYAYHAWGQAGMQQIVTAVRATGSTNICMCGGIGWAGDVSQWLAHVPTDTLSPPQIACSLHWYPPGTAPSPATENGAGFTGNASTGLGSILASYPIIIGETGDNCSTTSTTVASPGISQGQTGVTSIPCAALPSSGQGAPGIIYPVDSGHGDVQDQSGYNQLIAVSYGLSNQEIFQVNAQTAPGNTSITVVSQTAAHAHAIGDPIMALPMWLYNILPYWEANGFHVVGWQWNDNSTGTNQFYLTTSTSGTPTNTYGQYFKDWIATHGSTI